MTHQTRHSIGGLMAAAVVLSLPVVVSNRALDDWPQWRGPKRDGISAEKGLLKDWPQGGPPLAWKAGGAGDGYSSFSSSGGRLYTLGARGGREYVMAFDAGTGKKVWEVAHGARFGNDRGDGPRGTPTIDGDRMYAYGASGDLTAMDPATGKVFWSVNVLRASALEHPVGDQRIAGRTISCSSMPADRARRSAAGNRRSVSGRVSATKGFVRVLLKRAVWGHFFFTGGRSAGCGDGALL